PLHHIFLTAVLAGPLPGLGDDHPGADRAQLPGALPRLERLDRIAERRLDSRTHGPAVAAVGGEIHGALGQLAGLLLLAVLERLDGLAGHRVAAAGSGFLRAATLDLLLEPLPGGRRP